MSLFKRKHRHEVVESHTTNLGYFKESCACGAYRCRDVTGRGWVEPSIRTD